MARIPTEGLERLNRQVSVERLVQARWAELKRPGNDLRGRCPFREESDPSLPVDPAKDIFHCFGWGAKTSVVDLVMALEGVAFRHAVGILRTDYHGLSRRRRCRQRRRSMCPRR